MEKKEYKVLHVLENTHKKLRIYCEKTDRKMRSVTTEAIEYFLKEKGDKKNV